MTLRWSEIARWDLDQIFDFICIDHPFAAADTLLGIVKAADRLLKYPMLGHAGREQGTRELIVAPYIIVYRIKDSTLINIEAVLHGAQRF